MRWYKAKTFDVKIWLTYLVTAHKFSGDNAAKAASALNWLYAKHDIPCIRNDSISYTIKCLKIKFPSEKRKKRPFCHILVYLFFKSFRQDGDWLSFTGLAAINLGYWLGMRPGEYSFHSGARLLRFEQVSFIPDIEDPKELTILLSDGLGAATGLGSKTNQRNEFVERLAVQCKCGMKRFGYKIVCPVHFMKKYIRRCERKFGPYKEDDPLLKNKEGKRYQYHHLNHFLHNGLDWIAKYSGVPIDSRFYTPHSLRVGGTTDNGRDGWQCFKITRFGRWRTTEWRDIYIQLDFYDIAKLRGETTTEIRNGFNFAGIGY